MHKALGSMTIITITIILTPVRLVPLLDCWPPGLGLWCGVVCGDDTGGREEMRRNSAKQEKCVCFVLGCLDKRRRQQAKMDG